MVVLTVNKKLLKVIIVSALVILLVVSSLNIMVRNYQHKTLINNISNLEETFESSLLISPNGYEKIEIFDIGKGKVIKVVQINETALVESQKYLQGIVGMYLKVKAFPDKGYIIKIPFEPNIIVKNHFLNDDDINSIDKVFILLPEEKAPYLLVLDDRERPYFYCFKGDINKLLKSLNFEKEAEKTGMKVDIKKDDTFYKVS